MCQCALNQSVRWIRLWVLWAQPLHEAGQSKQTPPLHFMASFSGKKKWLSNELSKTGIEENTDNWIYLIPNIWKWDLVKSEHREERPIPSPFERISKYRCCEKAITSVSSWPSWSTNRWKGWNLRLRRCVQNTTVSTIRFKGFQTHHQHRPCTWEQPRRRTSPLTEYSRATLNPYISVDGSGYGLLDVIGIRRVDFGVNWVL